MRYPATVLLGLMLSFAVAAQGVRRPVPTANEQAGAEKLVRELFKADYAKGKPADRAALARKLLEQVGESAAEPIAQYVLLREARDLAAKGGDGATYVKAAGDLAAAFQVSVADAMASALDTLLMNMTATVARDTVPTLLQVADGVTTAGDLEAAQKLLKSAGDIARKSGVASLATAVQVRSKTLTTLRRDFDRLADSLRTLEKNPADPEANQLVGKFQCFVRGDWDTGLPRLAQARDAALKNAARKDLQAKAGKPIERAEAGDDWYAIAAGLDPLMKTNVQQRALHWYRLSTAEVNGLTKLRVDKRIEELARAGQPKVVETPVKLPFAAIRTAVKNKQIKDAPLHGATFNPQGRAPFLEAPPQGGILVGFHYTLTAIPINQQELETLQAIYLTDKGDKVGVSVGRNRTGARAQTVRAKPGYAIGSVTTHTGNTTYLHGIRCTFMKMTDRGLDPLDSYEGPALGSVNLPANPPLDSEGNFIVGIFGRMRTATFRPECLSIISVNLPENRKVP